MEKILNVASYIVNKYEEISGVKIDEMKLHKLLYFTQREAIAITGKAMFAEPFEGWKYGPVNRVVRDSFTDEGLSFLGEEDILNENKYIINNIIHQYGSFESWKLSKISHNEYSWKQARIGIAPEENGSNLMKVEDIFIDAEKVRPYDSVYDMYYDEFDDMEELL